MNATSGQVIYTLPSPEEMEKRGEAIKLLRRQISDIRNKVDDERRALIKEGHWDDDGLTRDLRDVNAFLTASLVHLYTLEDGYPKWASSKREMLSHPEIYVIREGYSSPIGAK